MRYGRYCPLILKEFLSFSGLKILFRGQELLGGLKPIRKRGVLQKINEGGTTEYRLGFWYKMGEYLKILHFKPVRKG